MKVMIFGTFDILHFGHIKLFEQAKKHGEYLVVVIARDVNVAKIKGHKPFHNEKERAGLLQHINIIDEARLGYKKNVYQIIQEVKPDVIALGYDQKEFVGRLEEKINEFGLNIKVIRLRSFKAKTHKSSKVQKYINKM